MPFLPQGAIMTVGFRGPLKVACARGLNLPNGQSPAQV